MKYKVIVTKGPNEPWWQDENTKDEIIFKKECADFSIAKKVYREWYNKLGQDYELIKEQNEFQAAFYNPGEMIYCVECADDVQLYCGLEMISR